MSYIGLVPSESNDRPAAPARRDHEDRLRARPPAAGRGRLALPLPPGIGMTLTDRQDGQPPEAIAIAWSAQRRLHRTWARLEARAQTPHDHRRRRRPRARRLRLGDHPNRITTTPTHRLSRRLGRWRPGNARGTRELTMSNPPPRLATPDLRQRLPTTNHGPAATTRVYQSDRASRTALPDRHPPSRPHNHSTPTQRKRRNS